MFISIGIDEDGRPYITTSDGSREKVVRKGKGKSVIDFPSTYTVLDIETTGLDPRYCEIIEISAMKYSSGQNIGTFSTLVKPSEPIDEYITSLTGITNDMLKNAPDIVETMQKFYNFVGSDLIVGYNVNFDINFLYDNLLNCHSLTLSNSFIDVMRIARKVLPDLKNHKQVTVAEHYGISTAGAHRAAVDCEICKPTFWPPGKVSKISNYPVRKANCTLKTFLRKTFLSIPPTRFSVRCAYSLEHLKKCPEKTLCN